MELYKIISGTLLAVSTVGAIIALVVMWRKDWKEAKNTGGGGQNAESERIISDD